MAECKIATGRTLRNWAVRGAAAAIAGVVSIATPTLSNPYKGPPTPCDRGLSPKDAATVLKGNVTINHYSMAASVPGEGCELGVADGNAFAMVDVSIRNGAKNLLQMDLAIGGPHTAVTGFGDEAYLHGTTASNIPNANETDFYVRKGDLLCTAELHRTVGAGSKLVIPMSDDDVAMKLGGLCAKALSIHGAK